MYVHGLGPDHDLMLQDQELIKRQTAHPEHSAQGPFWAPGCVCGLGAFNRSAVTAKEILFFLFFFPPPLFFF